MSKRMIYPLMLGLASLALLLCIVQAMASNGQWAPSRALKQALADTRRDLIISSQQLSDRPDASEIPYFENLLAARQMNGYSEGDQFIGTFAVTVGKLTPFLATDVYQSYIEDIVLEPMVARSPDDLSWQGVLADDWEVSEDGLTLIFHLRRGVVFSDGSPFTSKDVMFTFDLIKNPELNAPRLAAYYENVVSWESLDDYTVRFKLAEPYFLGFSVVAGTPIVSSVFYSQFSMAEINTKPGLLVGSGAYMLADDPIQWRPGRGQITLVRNDYYWGPRPALDKIIWREMPDEVARTTAFRNGEIDALALSGLRYRALKDDANLQQRGELKVFDDIAGGYLYIGWNQVRDGKPTFFADQRVRQAMSMLINREEMAREIMAGLATPTSGPFHPSGQQANKEIQPWPHDPERAKQLLAQAGFEDRDADGVIEDAQGNDFRFKLTYSSSSPTTAAMMLYIRDALKRAGIILEPDGLEWTIMLQRIDGRDFDSMILGWGGSVEGDPRQMFHSDMIEDGGDNYISHRNAALDQAIDEARVTVDEQERRQLWHEVHRLLHEQQPYTFLFTRKDAVYLDNRFGNVRITLIGPNPKGEWAVPINQQVWGD
ncbi:MAG: ABC transporter substrate-binding protein [Planctomycetota bacterium]